MLQPAWGRYTQSDPLPRTLSRYSYGDGNPLSVIDPLGLYGVELQMREVPMTNIRAACPGLGSACTIGAIATLRCQCDCEGKLDVTLILRGTIYYYPGNPRTLRNVRPFDTTVTGPDTGVWHEWNWHLAAGIRRVHPIIRELEARSPFGSKENCGRTCGDYAVWVN